MAIKILFHDQSQCYVADLELELAIPGSVIRYGPDCAREPHNLWCKT